MIQFLVTGLALSLPLNDREIYRKKINIKINHWTSILDSPLSWREREMVFENLSILYYEEYILDNVPVGDYFPQIDFSKFDKWNGTEYDYPYIDLE